MHALQKQFTSHVINKGGGEGSKEKEGCLLTRAAEALKKSIINI